MGEGRGSKEGSEIVWMILFVFFLVSICFRVGVTGCDFVIVFLGLVFVRFLKCGYFVTLREV